MPCWRGHAFGGMAWDHPRVHPLRGACRRGFISLRGKVVPALTGECLASQVCFSKTASLLIARRVMWMIPVVGSSSQGRTVVAACLGAGAEPNWFDVRTSSLDEGLHQVARVLGRDAGANVGRGGSEPAEGDAGNRNEVLGQHGGRPSNSYSAAEDSAGLKSNLPLPSW